MSHIPDLDSVFEGVHSLLAPNGAFVFEDPYLGDIVGSTAFDQFYDEHVFYFSVRSVRQMLEKHGLQLVDAIRVPVHGGSMRYTAARPGRRRVSGRVPQLLAEEGEAGFDRAGELEAFRRRVEATRAELIELLRGLAAEGKSVVGYGATAKSSTVINYCGITTELVSFVCDSTPAKQGRLTPGAHLPVLPPESFFGPHPDYALLFAWNHAGEIMGRERAFVAGGGRWILYVPEVTVTRGCAGR
jgi:methylation protein EvaC